MKKKVVWLVVTVWMVAALLLASCAPAVTEKEAEKVAPAVKEKEAVVVPKEVVVPEKKGEWVKWTGTKRDGTVVEKMIEKPRYGGVYIEARDVQPDTFDEYPRATTGNWYINPTNDDLLTRDWARGPGGTGEWSGQQTVFSLTFTTGELAESWEIPDASTFVFHLRKGVHWALNPTSEASRLVGGREVTTEDVVFSMRRAYLPGGRGPARAPLLADMKKPENSIYVSPTDKWAIVVKVETGKGGIVFETLSQMTSIIPPEVIEKYGSMNDARNVVGSGPFILKDYVGASTLTWVRNPNYWRKDPFFPENQLPYVDTLKVLIIPDMSTRQAALRTGKVDILIGLDPEAAESLLKTNPQLEWSSYVTSGPGIYMRIDTKPFDDIRVRRALWLAIDNYKIRNEYYEGKASMYNSPIYPTVEYMDMYWLIEGLPESTRELFGYNPDKARQLLAEAGYPQGFKTEVITQAKDVDLLSIVKEYWAKIGVDLKIDVKDFTVYESMRLRKTYSQLLMRELANGANPFTLTDWRAASAANYSKINDPQIEQAYLAIQDAYFDEPKKRQIMRDLVPYIREQSWSIDLPVPNLYVLWQPWLKGYYGVTSVGNFNGLEYSRYIWIDQELKEAMGR